MDKIKWAHQPPFIVWNKVKALRKERKFNQTQVAAGADIAISSLWMIEQGYDRTTSERTKDKLAKFFKCNVDDIFPAQMIGDESKESKEAEALVSAKKYEKEKK